MTGQISTVIPTFGTARFLEATLASIERQSSPPEEVVVVDDGSEVPVTLSSDYLRLRVVRIEHGGIAAARNAGMRATSCPLVHICDHDDLLEPAFYERILEMFSARPSADVVQTACGFIDDNGAVRPGVLPGGSPNYASPSETLRTLLSLNPIASVATVFRRELAERLGGFEQLDFVQDWDFWLRAASAGGDFTFVNEVLAWHRVHPAQQSSPERAPLILAEARRMLRAQTVPLSHWLAREQGIADLHVQEAMHHLSSTKERRAALRNLVLAGPIRPRACLRAFAHVRS